MLWLWLVVHSHSCAATFARVFAGALVLVVIHTFDVGALLIGILERSFDFLFTTHGGYRRENSLAQLSSLWGWSVFATINCRLVNRDHIFYWPEPCANETKRRCVLVGISWKIVGAPGLVTYGTTCQICIKWPGSPPTGSSHQGHQHRCSGLCGCYLLQPLIDAIFHCLDIIIIVLDNRDGPFKFKLILSTFSICDAAHLSRMGSRDIIVLKNSVLDVPLLRQTHFGDVEDGLSPYFSWGLVHHKQVFLLLVLICCHPFQGSRPHRFHFFDVRGSATPVLRN